MNTIDWTALTSTLAFDSFEDDYDPWNEGMAKKAVARKIRRERSEVRRFKTVTTQDLADADM